MVVRFAAGALKNISDSYAEGAGAGAVAEEKDDDDDVAAAVGAAAGGSGGSGAVVAKLGGVRERLAAPTRALGRPRVPRVLQQTQAPKRGVEKLSGARRPA